MAPQGELGDTRRDDACKLGAVSLNDEVLASLDMPREVATGEIDAAIDDYDERASPCGQLVQFGQVPCGCY